MAEDCGVSIFISSLMPEELPRGKSGGGGVRTRSSKVFQNSIPPEFLIACRVKLFESRLSQAAVRISRLVLIGSDRSSSDSDKAGTVGRRFGEVSAGSWMGG